MAGAGILCRRLGIDVPIVQAPMAGAQGSALAAAVSNAGGLGSLPCAMLDADQMRARLEQFAGRGITTLTLLPICGPEEVPALIDSLGPS